MENQTNPTAKRRVATKPYVLGYLMSLILTLIPLFCVLNNTFQTAGLIAVIIGLAIVQMFIQLFFFMHVSEKASDGSSWHKTALILGLVVVFTIVVGSLWVMSFSSQVQ